jgi:hypothetical protein
LTFPANTNTFGATKIIVTVTDSQPTNNSASMSFNIVVNQIAIQPGLLTNGIVAPNSTFRYLLKPPVNNNDNFSYSLGPGSAPRSKNHWTQRKLVVRLDSTHFLSIDY